MRSTSFRAAAFQAILLLAVALVVVTTLAMRWRKPFDRDTLAIQVSLLQSNAAEAELLLDTAADDRLAPRFVHQHAGQLLQDVGRIENRLGSKPAIPSLEPQHAQARELTRTLTVALARATERALQPGATAPFSTLSARLDALHSQIKPAD